MIEIRIACRRHPRYMGYMKPRAKWSKYTEGCPGCSMVYDARSGRQTVYGIARPWVKIKVLRERA